jgi:glucose/mannose-6-phosphate isomerase
MNGPGAVDSLGMWEAAVRLPEQLVAARAVGRSVPLPPEQPISNVVALGVGADGTAGDLLGALSAPDMVVPIVVVKSAELPVFVGPDSLVLALSATGGAQSTLAAAGQAWERGAQVMVVSGDGPLAAMAERAGSPVVPVPADTPRPRAGLGALAVPALVVLSRLGLLPDVDAAVDAAVAQLRRRRDELERPGNEAAQVVRRIGRTFPLVHGSPGFAAVAAQRWKTQINENAKSPAFWAAHPDLCHNEVAGWGQAGDVTRQVLTLVELRHEGEAPAIARRFDLAAEVMAEVMGGMVSVWARGEGDLARFFDLVMVGDAVSLHLAAREGVDPGPEPAVDGIELAVLGLGESSGPRAGDAP